ncbi:hypothetical protein B7Y94_01995 [Candidatus Saccharibacteria bacterium 32-49-12]|nr:MAG: hypothetical protein B7Y94_01995 [Candidatus Saccharibacteria bacterium 32-49-12]
MTIQISPENQIKDELWSDVEARVDELLARGDKSLFEVLSDYLQSVRENGEVKLGSAVVHQIVEIDRS